MLQRLLQYEMRSGCLSSSAPAALIVLMIVQSDDMELRRHPVAEVCALAAATAINADRIARLLTFIPSPLHCSQ